LAAAYLIAGRGASPPMAASSQAIGMRPFDVSCLASGRVILEAVIRPPG